MIHGSKLLKGMVIDKVKSSWAGGKRSILKTLLLVSCIMIVSCSGGVKDYDGNLYKTVEIGKSIWMKENLNVTHFRNGDLIPQVKTQEEWIRAGEERKPAWCFMNNDTVNGVRYGRLYNWYAVTDSRGLAPRGWHAATDSEWTSMINYLGGGVLAALKMRTTGLDATNTQDDLYCFSGLPGGCRNNTGLFYGLDSFGYWWSTDEVNEKEAWLHVLNYVRCDVNSMDYAKIYGASVRCVKN
jgi:uncharacterized protein (TIGR02145 family)